LTARSPRRWMLPPDRCLSWQAEGCPIQYSTPLNAPVLVPMMEV
jgi:hypothetical protein